MSWLRLTKQRNLLWISSHMAVRFAASHRCIRAYLPSLRSVVQHFRTFSTQDNYSSDRQYVLEEPDITKVEWPDPSLGPLSPVDSRFPLPGGVGIIQDSTSTPVAPPAFSDDPVIVLPPQPSERHFTVLTHYLNREEKISMTEAGPKAAGLLECAAFDCPKILRKDFADLFPDRNTIDGPFTVITLSQRTENDMSIWSEDVENEREELLEAFMHDAMDICNSIQKNGFWADFIDPGSGKPFCGPHTNATFFETDERYLRFGFQIEDLGCCKVIRHPVWGTHAYVSCLFTNAPVDHPIIYQLTKPS